MRKIVLVLMVCFLLVAVNLYAEQGDVYVEGKLGVGTTEPATKLDIEGTDGYNLRIMDTSGWSTGLMMETTGTDDWDIRVSGPLDIYAPSGSLTFRTHNARTNWSTPYLTLSNTGKVGIGTTNPRGKLDVNGSIYQRGSQLHADYVFEPDYRLGSIEEHAKYMWENKHLKAIPKAKVDENGYEIIEIGAYRKGIVEELEKAHIYIEQLHKRIKTLEERLAKLESSINAEE
jgi:hypothetical protein